jgi:flagellar basal body-associated protein FliL
MSKEDIVPPRQLQSADFSRTNIFESNRSDLVDNDDLDNDLDDDDRLNESRPGLTFIGEQQPDNVYSQSNYSAVPSSGHTYTTETASQSYPSSVGTNSYYHNDPAQQPNTYATSGATYEPEVAFRPSEPVAPPIHNADYAGGQYVGPGIHPAPATEPKLPAPQTLSPPPRPTSTEDAMCCGCKRWIAITISIVSVIVVIVIVVVAVATSGNDDKEPATRDAVPISPVVRIPTTPTVSVPTPATVPVPTPFTISVPTPAASSIVSTRPTEQAQAIIAYLNEITLSGATLTSSSSAGATNEDLAVGWLLDQDPLQLDLSSATSKFRLEQRFALAALFFGPAAWLVTLNWGTENECNWYGITCDFTTGAVTQISLASNNIHGSIPPDLGLLTSMTSLSLSTNALTGTLPESIGRLSSLQTLDLTSNSLTGPIPSSIGTLSLVVASFALNLFTGTVPSTLCSNSGLTLLAADCTKVACSCCTVCS